MTLCALLLVTALPLAGEPTNDPPNEPTVRVSARLAPGALEVGGSSSFVVEVTSEGGASTARAGVPAPILQLDVPAGVTLEGEHLSSLEAQMENEFLEAPYERLIEDGSARVAFRLDAQPDEDATIGIVVTGYVDGGPEGPWFLRRRLELPLVPGAAALPGDDADSSWGTDPERLTIGAKAPPFELPRPDGSTVALEQFLGAKNVLISTNRAYW